MIFLFVLLGRKHLDKKGLSHSVMNLTQFFVFNMYSHLCGYVNGCCCFAHSTPIDSYCDTVCDTKVSEKDEKKKRILNAKKKKNRKNFGF